MKLDLELNEVNVVMLSLAKQPYEAVAPLIDKIKGQAEEQLKVQPETPVEE